MTVKLPPEELVLLTPSEYVKEMLINATVPPPLPPNPPSPIALQEDKIEPKADELLDQAGVTNEQFAVWALDQPALWQPEEMELFESILAGEQVDRSFLSDLYSEVISGRRTAKKVREAVRPVELAAPEEKDEEEVAEDKTSVPVALPPPKISTEGIDTTDWWKKKK